MADQRSRQRQAEACGSRSRTTAPISTCRRVRPRRPSAPSSLALACEDADYRSARRRGWRGVELGVRRPFCPTQPARLALGGRRVGGSSGVAVERIEALRRRSAGPKNTTSGQNPWKRWPRLVNGAYVIRRPANSNPWIDNPRDRNIADSCRLPPTTRATPNGRKCVPKPPWPASPVRIPKTARLLLCAYSAHVRTKPSSRRPRRTVVEDTRPLSPRATFAQPHSTRREE